jgi:hypothetical protein
MSWPFYCFPFTRTPNLYFPFLPTAIQSLRDFWTAYFQKTGATLKIYTVLREPPQLRR